MLNKETLNNLLRSIDVYIQNNPNEDIQLEKCNFCKDVISMFYENYEEWKLNCPFSMQNIGEYLNEKYITIRGIDDKFYLTCARFFREYLLSEQRKGHYIPILNDDWNKFKRKSPDLIDKNHNSWLEYLLNNQFDIDVLNHYLGDKSFQAFLNYENNLKNAEEKSENLKVNIADKASKLENFIKEKEKRVNELAELLKEQKTAFNFVGLSKGFEKLLSQKLWSKWTSFGIMSVFCVLLIALPIVIIGGRFFNWFAEYNIEWSKIGWEQMLPMLGLEFIFIYFFRVALTHYNSIQTQIMQLELRQSLCQFIQSYADYAKEIKEKDGVSLEKFENLIFSSILSTPDKVPSTFDGLEQLSNLIKEFKK
ncbi:hypothetical protein [Actinobacillus suis]|uniref:Uncharacterized protein n=2 Tax=Actinobacillus suis TaxID=716 RepID=K0G0C1_ACTSU|nr:hypothetical protein [Actinobacillus suis]AFU20372.1 hypothetical protein ASU2_11225 [Actinobacillus suis H91-0380]AIJ32503.1 hypothetical protein ASU1_11245 [Actinobacillus suis ATCC 33415]MCQ9630769.1 hypothetical protein [Actinobacillus suis]MCQ9633102.1 hypothetical protein [Actinobacillus suis]MCQ9712760.1 hypothetical protein [Actinobacillus suis]